MKSKKNKPPKTLLSDKIADALTVKPRADIEDDQVFGTKPQTVSRGEFSESESDEEVAISDFRKRNVNLLSEISKKYVGQVVTQEERIKSLSEESISDDEDTTQFHEKEYIANKEDLADDSQEFQGSASDNSDDEGESDDYDISKTSKNLGSEDATTEESEGEEEGEGLDISQIDAPVLENFEHVKKQDISEEAKKGNSVRNQLLLWEGLLEMRIHLQRCMNTVNQMPMPEVYEELNNVDYFSVECNQAKANITSVLDKFLTLQNMLLKQYPETKNMSSNIHKTEPKEKSKPESDEEIPSDTDNEEIPSDTEVEDNLEDESPKHKSKNLPQSKKRKLEDYENDLEKKHKAFKSFRDVTIQKWNDKTRLTTAANIKSAPTNTVLQQISYILSDKNKLIRRTQLKRSEYDIVGYKKESPSENQKDPDKTEINPITRDRKDDDEYVPEIFDDSDFYHQLLRELIECKSADISDPVQLSRQWIALQQMRSKMKRKVDTKATKGRKIKYVVHNQLVNFMAPEKSLSWTDEASNELYSSLFGKMYENNKIGMTMDLEN